MRDVIDVTKYEYFCAYRMTYLAAKDTPQVRPTKIYNIHLYNDNFFKQQ